MSKTLFYTSALLLSAFSGISQEIRSFQKEGLYGFVQNARVIIAPEYDYAFDFQEGLALVEKGDKWGFIDPQNSEIVPLIYDRCSNFTNGLSVAIKNGKMGVLDKSGVTIVPVECDNVLILEEGYCLGTINAKHALFHEGRQLTKYMYDEIEQSYCGLFYYKKDDLYGVLSTDGSILIEPQFKERPHCVKTKNGERYIEGKVGDSDARSIFSGTGKLVIDGSYYSSYSWVKYQEICMAEKDGKITVINVITGEELLPMTNASIIDVDWRPCDGYGYESPPFLFFEANELVIMLPTDYPSKRVDNAYGLPFIYDEIVIVPKASGKYDVYRKDMTQIASEVHVKPGIIEGASYNEDFRICTLEERGVWMWKEGKFGKWNATNSTLEFVTSGNSNELLLGNDLDVTGENALINVVHSDDKNLLFERVSGSKKRVYLFKDDNRIRELGEFATETKIKFIRFEYDGEDLYNIVLKVDGKKEYYE